MQTESSASYSMCGHRTQDAHWRPKRAVPRPARPESSGPGTERGGRQIRAATRGVMRHIPYRQCRAIAPSCLKAQTPGNALRRKPSPMRGRWAPFPHTWGLSSLRRVAACAAPSRAAKKARTVSRDIVRKLESGGRTRRGTKRIYSRSTASGAPIQGAPRAR